MTLADGDLSYAPLQNARAAFCELLASESSIPCHCDEREADLLSEGTPDLPRSSR